MRFIELGRREFISLIGSAAAWPIVARAQQPALPVIGFLSSRSPVESAQLVAAFRDGLKGNGFVEDRSVRIEYRWAEGQYDRLAGLASDLVNRNVAAIAAVGNTPSAYAARTATTTIPVVFVIGDDPIEVGLVDSLSHPRGNLTGVTVLFGALGPKRIEVLHEIMPDAVTIAMLVNSNNPTTGQAIKAVQEAALIHRQKLVVQTAGTEGELETAFAGIAQQHATALILEGDPFFTTRRDQLVALAARYAIPVIARFRGERWPDELRRRSRNWLSRCWRLHRADSKRSQASRSSSTAVHESRTGCQPQNCEGARPCRPHLVARPCRRGDRITMSLLRRMSPVMALFGHADLSARFLLSGVDRTCRSSWATSGFDGSSGARTADFICSDMRAGQIEDRCLDAERAGPGYHVAQDMFALGGGTTLDVSQHRPL
jgi:putative tryptophan/tyrosine transport system substrate-binding protein